MLNEVMRSEWLKVDGLDSIEVWYINFFFFFKSFINDWL